MKPSVGEVNFQYTTENDELLNILGGVYYDRFGEAEIDILELQNENGEIVNWHKLSAKDRDKIESYIYKHAIPQDEVYDEYEDYEDF